MGPTSVRANCGRAKFHKILQIIQAILLTLVSFTAAPFFILLFYLPVQFYRSFLKIWAEIFKPELGGIVPRTSAIMGADDLYGCPSMTIVVCNIFNGTLDAATIKHVMTKSVLSARLNTGDYKFPQLRQSLARWGGYYFWKKENNFDINQHISIVSCLSKSAVDEMKLHSVFLEIVQKPFEQGRPLWEVSLLDNIEPLGNVEYHTDETPGSRTAVFLRLHHILGDGYSIMNMLQNGLLDCDMNKNDDIIQPTPALATIARSASQRIKVWVQYPYQYMYEQVQTRDAYRDTVRANTETRYKLTERNGSKKSVNKRVLAVHVSKSISIHKLKTTKDTFNVTFTSVLLSAMAKSFQQVLPNSYTAPYLASHVVMPTPHHGSDLSNEMSTGTVYLPISEEDDIKQLESCHREYESEKKSTTPLGSIILMNLIGGLPLAWYENGKHGQALVKACISNFPGPTMPRHLQGMELVDCFFSGGLYPGLDLEVSALSCNGRVKFCVLADRDAITKDKLEVFTNTLVNHCNHLYKISSKINKEQALLQNSKFKLH